MRRTLVLGIGNVLLGDEGVGVHGARALQNERMPEGVTVLDGGTGGFHLLSCFSDFDAIVIIDASLDDLPLGTVRLLEPRYPADFPRTLSAHDIGLRDLVEAAALTGAFPPIRLVAVTIAEDQPLETSLSPEISAAMPRVIAAVHEALSGLQRASGAKVM